MLVSSAYKIGFDILFINPSARFAVTVMSGHLNRLLRFAITLTSDLRHQFKRPYKFMFLLYSVRFNADLLCTRNIVTYACLVAVKILSCLIVCSYKQSHFYGLLLSGVFQQQCAAIRTPRNVGVARNCVVQDRLIFVMYKAENSYNKTYG
jgi:hypothetical protein